MTFQQFIKLRHDHLKIQHDLELYEYQEVISDRIIAALSQNLNITSKSTPEEIDSLEQHELSFEVSRQGGKTKAVGHTNEIVMSLLAEEFDIPIRIGVFAPQVDQARLSYEITRNALRPIKGLMETTIELKQKVREEENARKLVLPNGSSCVVAPISTTSKIEGLTLDLIIIDEAQEADDKIVKHSIWPMGKTTNAPRVYIGKAGTRICHFYRLRQNGTTLMFYFDQVAKMRRALYKKTGDARHLIYEKSVREDILKYGEDADEIQREYFGVWQIGTGQFTTQDDLNRLVDPDRSLTNHDKSHECYVGIDTAKFPDSTVVTVLRHKEEDNKRELIDWLELRGDNYKDQFDVIKAFLDRFNVMALAIDSTGQGDFMPDMFERETQWTSEFSGLFRIKFSQVSKDAMYKNLKVVIKEFLTTLPKLDTKLGDKFRQQMLDLQQEYRGPLLNVKHPDDPNAHDDFPDSWALAEWAFAKWTELDKAGIAVVEVSKGKERKADTDDSGNVTDYWPGVD